MHDTLTSLASAARHHPFAEKWLIAPSRRAGHQWVERVVRAGTDVLNLRVTTPLALALELAAPSMASDGVTLATGRLGTMLVDSVWDVVAKRDYLGRLGRTDSIAELVWNSLNALRLADVEPARVSEEHLEHRDKALDLRDLHDAYVERLREEKLVDEADVYRRAMDRMRSVGIPADTLYLVPGSLRPRGLQREFLESLPGECRLRVEIGARSDHDVGLLSRLSPMDTTRTTPELDGSVDFLRAVGEVNEVRGVLRRCLADGIAFDEVEVLVSDSETYVPLFREIGRGFVADDRPEGLPITFADGIPTAGSRPGRALAAWLGWIGAGYPQTMLVRMIGDGLLTVDTGSETLGRAFLAELLRPLAIGQGREHYTPKLDEQVASLVYRVGEPSGAGDPEDRAGLASRRRRLAGVRALRRSIGELVELSERLAGPPAGALDAADRFLSEHAGRGGEFDEFSRVALGDAVRDAGVWAERLDTSLDVPAWLASLPGSVRVLGSGPRPGHLHVAHLGAGGHSGRRATFVAGLDDARFPGANLQDPILLDEERRALASGLATSSDGLAERMDDLALRLASIAGTLVLSWSCHDVRDGRETFPSPFVLSAFRLVTGRTDADMSDLDAAAGPPVSFAPAPGSPALSEGELWLARFSSRRIAPEQRRECVRRRYPHLARGEDAVARRLGGTLNAFNGFVPEAGEDLDPFGPEGTVLSASALETAGRCPLAFFFSRALRLKPLEELEVDPDRWLDPATYGSLLHEVFRSFMAQLAAEDERPDFERDHARLAGILREAIGRYRDLVPPPNETAFRTQCWELAQVARVFLDREAEHCRTNRPRYFELALGLDPIGEGTALDSPDPVTVTLASGRTLRVRGRIDRIDELDGPESLYGIWDYKTGSARGYESADPFRQGRRVQNALYRLMVEAALARGGLAGARVAESGYLFPGTRAQGKWVSWTADELAPGEAVLDALGRGIAAGVFVPTSDADDCNYCDHRAACGDVEAVAAHGKGLLRDAALVQIEAFRELRNG
jgi:RecB family exonuclease